MVEDQRQVMIVHEMAKEFEKCVVEFNQRANGVNDRDTLIELRLEQNDRLAEMIARHRRHLHFMQGKPVEPQQHYGEAVLLPVMGGG